MDSKVTVVASEAGTVIHVGKNPDYGYVKLVQTRHIIDEESGFLRMQEVSTLLHGRVDHLQLMGYKADQELPGRIIIEESMEPFNKKNPEYDIKKAGKTGIVCTVDGKPIYRKSKYTLKADVGDTFIEHDEACKEKLREAFRAQQASSSAVNSSNSQFDLEDS